jgi:hypothetical protein
MEEYLFEAVNLSTNPCQPVVWSFSKNIKNAINQIDWPKLLKSFGLRIFGCQSSHSIIESIQIQFSGFKLFNKVHQISFFFICVLEREGVECCVGPSPS